MSESEELKLVLKPYSHKQIAGHLNISERTVRYRLADPEEFNVKELRKLADLTGVSVEYLINVMLKN